MKVSFVRWQANFYTGLAVVLPAVMSVAILIWLFGGVANITDKPLFFLKFILDDEQIYTRPGSGTMLWWWRVVGLLLAILLIGTLGALARHYIGKKLILLMHEIMLRIPLLNKIYGAIKQVNDAFTASNKSSFKHVVMVEWPHPGIYSIGFFTGDDHQEIQARTGERIVSVFVPTTPNPTTGFLVLVPESKVTRLHMPVADGIKYIMSLGAVAPPYSLPSAGALPASGFPPPALPESADSTLDRVGADR